MKLRMTETIRMYFDADFEIRQDDELLGKAAIRNCMQEDPGSLTVTFAGRKITMTYPGVTGGFKGFDPAYRHLLTEDGREAGYIERISDGGFFSKDYHMEMVLDGEKVFCYEVKLGEEGTAFPLYRDGKIKGQGRLPQKIYQDRYNYTLAAEDEVSALMLILCLCYRYYAFAFVPGKETEKAFERTFGTTRNKPIRDKYDPDYEKRV